ncbi:hypothetical protein T11_17703 [Trichinella zimbabwensis]|uniref:Uncharacterized protein n=1 Tax=Trichinella zimbabwensis TaxID=268475 RepID=A0A0V1GU67_9BILA|nr:hypothetical protein T11_17703 [Trichinella zimbabwensis]
MKIEHIKNGFPFGDRCSLIDGTSAIVSLADWPLAMSSIAGSTPSSGSADAAGAGGGAAGAAGGGTGNPVRIVGGSPAV